MTDLTKPTWLRGMLSGADNVSPAIARVLSFVVVLAVLVFLIIGLPAVVTWSMWLQKVAPTQWFALLSSLGTYVPVILLALATFATGFIRLTAQTEPAPAPPPAEGQ